jgi:hypothetical protein
MPSTIGMIAERMFEWDIMHVKVGPCPVEEKNSGGNDKWSTCHGAKPAMLSPRADVSERTHLTTGTPLLNHGLHYAFDNPGLTLRLT